MARKKLKIPSLNQLKKKFPGFHIAKEEDEKPQLWLPCEVHSINYTLGGGIPYGKILELFGEESSSKSMLALNFAKVCHSLGGVVLWADAEQAFTNRWAEQNGLDLDRTVIYSETSIEKISDWVGSMAMYWRTQLVKNEPILLVIDSMSALDTELNINSEMSNASADMGNRAKAIYKYFRIRNEMLYSLGICQIYINQLRTNLKAGMFADPECLHYSTTVPFTDGTSMMIGDIVKNKISKNVWSFNERTHEWEEKPIVGWVEKDPTDDWLNIQAEGLDTKNGVFGFTCTRNHLVMTKEGWKFAKDLTLDDQLLTKYTSHYSNTLLEFLQALSIGDACIRIRKRSTASIHLCDTVNQEYCDWKKSMLEPFMSFKKRSKYWDSDWRYENMLLRVDRDPIRIFENGISDLTLAIWYMDDGHLHKSGRASISIPSHRTDIDELTQIFHRNGLDCTYSGKNLYFNNSSELFSRICTMIHPSMQYKLPSEWRGKYRPFKLTTGRPENRYTYVNLLSIQKAGIRCNRKPFKYDLTIEDNHNFLVGNPQNGVLAHNTTPGGAALKFYASIRIGMYGGKTISEKINGKERKMGRYISIRTKKNKVAPPRATIKAAPVYNNPRYHEVGFDKLHFLDEVLMEEEIIEVNRGIYRYHDKVIARGEDNFKEKLEEDSSLRRKLLKEANINTVGTTRKLIESLQVNLYPLEDVEVDDYEEEDYEEEG